MGVDSFGDIEGERETVGFLSNSEAGGDFGEEIRASDFLSVGEDSLSRSSDFTVSGSFGVGLLLSMGMGLMCGGMLLNWPDMRWAKKGLSPGSPDADETGIGDPNGPKRG